MDRRVQDQGAVGRLTAQYKVVSVLAEAKTLSEAAPRLLEAIGPMLGWELGAIWYSDADAAVLRCAATWRAPGLEGLSGFEELSRQTPLAHGAGLPGRVVAEGEPVWVEDVQADARFQRTAAAVDAGLHAAIAFPIASSDEPLGVIEFFMREARAPDPPLLELMGAFGSQIGQFIEHRHAEEAVRASEALKSAILDSALDCVITIDHEGLVVDFNPAAQQTFGYERKCVLGEEMARFIIPPALRDHHREALARYLSSRDPRILDRRLELTGMRSDGSEFPVELTVTRVVGTEPPMFTGYVRDITERQVAERQRQESLTREQKARAEAEEAHRRSQQLVAEALNAEDRERRRMSEALHDEAVQNLLAARLDLDEAQSGDTESLARIREEIEATLRQLRESVADLHPIALSQGGLVAALQGVAVRAERYAGFRASVRVDPRVVGECDQFLHSLAREFLRNAAKHSRASRVSVLIEERGESISLEVADDGQGMAADRREEALTQGHIGLASSAERVRALGGSFELDSQPGRGTVVSASIPRVACEVTGAARKTTTEHGASIS